MNATLNFPEQFWKKFPNYCPNKAKKKYEKYLNHIRTHLIKEISVYGNNSIFYFSLYNASKSCGKMYYENKEYYIWNEFSAIKPIIQVLKKGNNMSEKLSLVTISDQYIDLLIATNDGFEIAKAWFDGTDENSDVDYIPIDEVGLRHFIYNGEQLLTQHGHHSAYYDKIRKNLRIAKQVKAVSDCLYEELNEYVWPHIKKKSVYGRTYYHGVSLQNCSSELRHAVLGNHYQYDLEAAVYAVRLILAEDIFKQHNESMKGLFTHTKEYLDLKSSIRNRLAKHVKTYPDPVKLIKQAISAIGFGAKTHDFAWIDELGNVQHNSISDIIKNPAERHAVMTDPWIVEFKREQDDLTKLIATHWLNDENFVKQIDDVPNMKNNNGKFKHNQVLAYLFQHMETQIMSVITADLPVVVGIHDAFITKRPVNIIDLRCKLRDISEYLNIDKTDHGEFRTDLDAEEQQHREFIKQQELMVAQLHNKSVHFPQRKRVQYVSRAIEGHYDGSGYDGTGEYDRDLDPFYDESDK